MCGRKRIILRGRQRSDKKWWDGKDSVKKAFSISHTHAHSCVFCCVYGIVQSKNAHKSSYTDSINATIWES